MKRYEDKKGDRWLGRLLISIVLGFSTIILIINFTGSDEVFRLLKTADVYYVFLLFFVSILIIFVDSLRTFILLKTLKFKIPYKMTLENSLLGFYVSALTPFSAGGQPFQIWHLTRLKVNVESATMIVGIKFITSFSITVGWGMIAFFKYHELIKSIPYVGDLMYLGLIVTIGMYVFFVLLLINAKFIKFFLSSPVISFPMALLLRKKREEVLLSINEKVSEYKKVLRAFWKSSKSIFVLNIFLSFVMVFLILSTSYIALKAVNADVSVLKITSLQIAMNLIVYFLPTPGASGGMEGIFYITFSHILNKDAVAAGMVLWRTFTYYLTVLMGSLTSMRYLIINKNFYSKKHDSEIFNHRLKG